MKSFLKIFFSSCLGVFAGLLVLIFVGISVIGAGISAMVDGDDAPTKLKEHTVLKLDMSDLPEKVLSSPFDNLLSSDDVIPSSLTDVILSIRKAKENPNIEGIYINVQSVGGGLSAIDAVRRELIDFKKSGKFIVAYADVFTQGAYILSSVADKIVLNPEGSINLVGVALPSMMFHSAMQKLGVKMEVFKVGKFKGAVEPYILDKLSDANRLQMQQLAGGLWNSMIDNVCQSRNIDTQKLLSFVDEGGAFGEQSNYVSMNLVDTLAYRSDVEDIVRSYMQDNSEDIRMVTVDKMKSVPFIHKEKGEKVYVLYAEGEIMPSETTNEFSNQGIIDESLVDKIEALEKDDDIKAVVLRVNSPGGSAFISEQIWKALRDLDIVKPVVVSMGHLAASGGYYISSAAQYIVAEPNTITGSIGIFGMIPNAQELANKLGVSVDVVKTSPYANLDFSSAGISTLINPMDDGAKQLIQAQVERGYKTFLSRVAEGRNMTIDQVDSIGQGRVWLGKKALELGLVDELGGLEVATKKAAKLAGLSSFQVIYEETKVEKLSELLFNKVSNASDRFRASMFGNEGKEVLDKIRQVYLRSGLQAQMPYDMPY